MGNIYSRELFNDEKGVSVWIAWCDEPGVYELGRDKFMAERRLRDRDIDWRFIALSALMNQPFEGITAKERETIEAAITRIRNLDERLERRDGSA
jgi:hypothetical protein